MRQLLQAFRSLAKSGKEKNRMHVFMSAGERVDDRRDIGVPSLPGVLALEVGGYVDVLARLVLQPPDEDDKKEARYLLTTKHLDDDGFYYLAKNRLRLLPPRMKNPTIEKILNHWNAAK